MLLNQVETALMNNPVRAAIQRHVEARWLRKLGGAVAGGRALEIGCGQGTGVEIILDHFGAARVDAFDLDPKMFRRAKQRLARRGDRVDLWVGDVTAIPAEADIYDAVFDVAIIHHVPDWRAALREVHRVLRPGAASPALSQSAHRSLLISKAATSTKTPSSTQPFSIPIFFLRPSARLS